MELAVSALETLIDQLGGPNALPFIGMAVFGFVFFAVLMVVQTIQARTTVRKRAIAFNPVHTKVMPSSQQGGGRSSPRSLQSYDAEEASELLFAMEKGLSTASEKRLSKIRRDLIRAGYFSKEAVLYYYLARIVSAGLAAFLVSLVARLVSPDMAAGNFVACMIVGAAVGLLLPALYLHRRHSHLDQQCREGFPAFLDLLVVCSEAGLTPRAGIERVSREITRTHPFLGANLFLMSLELRAGRPLAEAVEGLGRRVNIDEVRSFGSLLQQTEAFCTNLTSTLRVFSEDMRARRFFRAEEKAYGLPVKLVLLAVFVFRHARRGAAADYYPNTESLLLTGACGSRSNV
jgi:pilus assembly protein TadC